MTSSGLATYLRALAERVEHGEGPRDEHDRLVLCAAALEPSDYQADSGVPLAQELAFLDGGGPDPWNG